MAPSTSNLSILDNSASAKGLDLASELFHRINRIIPQRGRSDRTTCLPLRDAVEFMRAHGYSQVPVVENGEVLGVFSFRSFAKEAASATLEALNKEKSAPGTFRSTSISKSSNLRASPRKRPGSLMGWTGTTAF